MRTNIQLPVVNKLTIKNYALYPGRDKRGLSIDFEDGVTVLAGINGVGKTTLLNLLLRMLVGPSDPAKMNQDIGRVSKRSLVTPKKFEYFKNRVTEVTDDSTATLELTIGDQNILITRKMASMSLLDVFVNKKRKAFETESKLIDELASMCGLSSAYDYHIVVRYLQFFSEERLPILWSAGTQFEFFNILLFDEKLSSDLHSTFAEIQKHDTDYRNRTHQLTKRRESLPQAEPTDLEIGALDAAISGASAEYSDLDRKYKKQLKVVSEIQNEISNAEHNLNEADATLSILEHQFSHEDARYIAQSLPSLDDKLKFLMQGIGSGRGCFICGTKNKKKSSEVSKELRKGKCFVCHEAMPKSENDNVIPLSSIKVRELEEKISKTREARAMFEAAINNHGERYAPAIALLHDTASQRLSAQRKLDALKAQRPSNIDTPYSELFAEIEREQIALAAIDAKRKSLTEKYRGLVDSAQEQMNSIKEDLASKLTYYAESFLQEKIEVKFKRNSPFKIATGAGHVNIPTFSILMTSNTHPIPQERGSSESVSESQKEFLDLAFRMALLDLISGSRNSMLVIETPEASLDSWFMHKAAMLMRQFAPDKCDHSRKLIATSNLNGTLMIPALLGLIGDDGSVRTMDANEHPHLIDLMSLTAGTAVLHQQEARMMLQNEIGRIKNG